MSGEWEYFTRLGAGAGIHLQLREGRENMFFFLRRFLLLVQYQRLHPSLYGRVACYRRWRWSQCVWQQHPWRQLERRDEACLRPVGKFADGMGVRGDWCGIIKHPADGRHALSRPLLSLRPQCKYCLLVEQCVGTVLVVMVAVLTLAAWRTTSVVEPRKNAMYTAAHNKQHQLLQWWIDLWLTSRKRYSI